MNTIEAPDFQGAPPYDNDAWPQIVKDVGFWRVGLDTEAIRLYGDRFDYDIERFATREEGRFSCYIDMVEHRLGPSSFCRPEQYVRWRQGRNGPAMEGFGIRELFAQIQEPAA